MRVRHRTTLRHRSLLVAAIAIASAAAGLAQQRDLSRADLPAGSGFLLGQVVEADGRTPVSGAVVQLTLAVSSSDLARQNAVAPGPLTARSSRTVITNGSGHFLFPALGKGTYAINVAAIGHLPGGYAQVKPNGGTRPIDLGENEPRSGIVIAVWKYGSITGTIVDDAGEPAVGAMVTLFSRLSGAHPTMAADHAAFTDDRGVYRFGELAPGTYTVGLVTGSTTLPAPLADTVETSAGKLRSRMWAEGTLTSPLTGAGVRVDHVVVQRLADKGGGLPPADDRGRMMTYATTFYPGTPVLRQASMIDVAPGEERGGVDLALKLVPGVRVSGVATGPNGVMKGLVVHIASAANGALSSMEPVGGGQAFTDERGAFEFVDVAPGPALIWAGRTPINPDDERKEDWSSGSETVTVGTTDLTGIALTLRPGAKVSGRVEFIGSKPRPQGRAGVVTLRPVYSVGGWRTGQAVPAPDGTFSTLGDPAGKYFIGVADPPGWSLKSITHDGKNITEEPIDLGPADLTDVVVTFIDKSTHVRGALTGPSGAPDTEADVIVFPADSTTWRDDIFSSRRVRLLAASLTGTYQFDNLPPGEYYLAAVDTRLTANWRDSAFLARLIPSAARIALADGEDKTVPLKRAVLRAQ